MQQIVRGGEVKTAGPVPASGSRGSSAKAWWGRAVFVAALALSAWLINRTLSGYSPDEIVAAMRAVPWPRLLGCLGFTAASYLMLTLFDWLGLRYVGRPIPWRSAAFASFTSRSLGHTIGFAGLSSGAIRYRLYSRWGLSVEEVAKLVLFCGVTVGLGLMMLGGIALVLRPDLAKTVADLSSGSARVLGTACLAGAAAYLGVAAMARRPLRIWTWSFAMPGLRLAAAQIVVGTINFAFVAAALHQALMAVAEVGYAEIAAIYVIANTATMVTHVPGGLGVIESVVRSFVQGREVIGGLLVFRCVYFFGPLALGAILFVVSEVARGRLAAPPPEAAEAGAARRAGARGRGCRCRSRAGPVPRRSSP